MQAYILISTDPGKPWEVAESTLRIAGVKTSQAVTGPFDVVTFVEFTNIDELGELLEKIHALNGVIKTQTAIAMPARLP
ncbi:Lrp/AsnC family transcriptional regulator [Candidatus Bathyarchaeota archaeon]|nr:Lrp/AsnC family transcriptional regulator [Candidatus Bathyarchaeota archaeon]NIV44386.1 Lrp/AsnC family transcriptional regulator [Candidatus Bathyarchaeota archaeon]NIW10776.1 Lrp/AsnC family transcriptional regulator [Gammaproteobacteria bacterium]